MSDRASNLERLAAIPRGEIASRASAWPEVQRALLEAAATIRAAEAHKESSAEMSTLAAAMLNRTRNGDHLQFPSPEEWPQFLRDVRSLAASVLSQDETAGQDEAGELVLDDPDAAVARNLRAAQEEGQAHPLVAVVKDGAKSDE